MQLQEQVNSNVYKPPPSDALSNKYHSPNIKSFDGFKA